MLYRRIIEPQMKRALARGKSILLLGPRQTGKTTLVTTYLKPDIHYSFAQISTRERYEKNPSLLEKELIAKLNQYSHPPLVFIDEVQKIPMAMDMAQHLIDSKKAQFILSGSSARKLKHGTTVNLLPGRTVNFTLSPLLYDELPSPPPDIGTLLIYGSLPGIIAAPDNTAREEDLYSYVSTYLEEEIRLEAVVRNLGMFARFLEIAAGESGKQLNFTRIAQDVGIADTTIANYYQILEDCLIVNRIDPITQSSSKRRLIKSPKYLFFDLGVRRACANEGILLPKRTIGEQFEAWVGNELFYRSGITSPHIKVRYWRDAAGPEIDYVLDIAGKYIPIEIKWTDAPAQTDARHLLRFMKEYNIKQSYIVCRTPDEYDVCPGVTALPYSKLKTIFDTAETLNNDNDTEQ